MTRESHKKEGLSLSLIHQKGPSSLSRRSHLHFAVVHSINCQISDHFNWPFCRYPKLKPYSWTNAVCESPSRFMCFHFHHLQSEDSILIPWEKGDMETLIAFHLGEKEKDDLLWITSVCVEENFVAIYLRKEEGENNSLTDDLTACWEWRERRERRRDVKHQLSEHTIITILDRRGGEKGKADRYRC